MVELLVQKEHVERATQQMPYDLASWHADSLPIYEGRNFDCLGQ